MIIDYSLLAKAISFYETKGYKYIEVPWYVPIHEGYKIPLFRFK